MGLPAPLQSLPGPCLPSICELKALSFATVADGLLTVFLLLDTPGWLQIGYRVLGADLGSLRHVQMTSAVLSRRM